MTNVIDFNRIKRAQEKSNQVVKATEIICPCTNNAFTFSYRQSSGQMYLLLQCVSCNHSYDVTEMLADMLNNETKQNTW